MEGQRFLHIGRRCPHHYQHCIGDAGPDSDEYLNDHPASDRDRDGLQHPQQDQHCNQYRHCHFFTYHHAQCHSFGHILQNFNGRAVQYINPHTHTHSNQCCHCCSIKNINAYFHSFKHTNTIQYVHIYRQSNKYINPHTQ